jgi:anti-anti-sigma factor
LETDSHGDVSVVSFLDKNILDEQNIRVVKAQLMRLIEDGHRKIALNLAPVEYLSSFGLDALNDARLICREAGGNMVLFNIRPDIMENFVITGHDKNFVIVGNEEAAKTALKSKDR